MQRLVRACVVSLGLLSSLLACTGGDDDADTEAGPEIPACVSYELDGCSLLYPPTYDQVWDQTLAPSCGQAGSACHGQDDAAGAAGGMTFVDPQLSWDHLHAGGETGALVVPGDPLCSPLFVRLASEDDAIRMPPGTTPLADGALCSIATWIEAGASE